MKRLTILALGFVLAACGSSSASSSQKATSAGGSTSTTTAAAGGPTTTTASAGPGPAGPCGPAHAHGLAASSVARVYSVGNTVYGCSKHGSTSYRLGQLKTCIGTARVSRVVVAGELTAYGLERCGVDTGTTSVLVRRLTDGKLLANRPATTMPIGPESYQSVSALVLERGGAVAWIAVGNSLVGHARDVEVHRLDKGGFVLLDSGPAILPVPLRLQGKRLSWKHGSSWRYATLG